MPARDACLMAPGVYFARIITFALLGGALASVPRSSAHDDAAPPPAAPTSRGLQPARLDVQPYRSAAERITAATREGTHAWPKLEVLCDEIGPRLSGSLALEKAIEWATASLKKDGLANVRAEPVMVPKWVRGNESLELLAPRAATLPMLGLGGSVATPPEGIEAEVLTVASADALRALGPNAAAGKIVLFNYAMPPYDEKTGSGYGRTVRYRADGATWAAEAGAAACLIRSVTARAMYAPHTGAMRYSDKPDARRIPAAAITIEDAEMFARLSRRGVPARVRLKMEARDEGLAPSANVVAELRGRDKPDEIVIISGHLDSWDVGHGAHDDGGPCVSVMEAAALLKRLDLTPRRTIRVVLWTNEENGLAGSKQYRVEHAAELASHVAAIESDSGVFAPQGFSIQMKDKAQESRAAQTLAAIADLLAPLGATHISPGYSGADIGALAEHGVACLGLDVEGSRYFDYHHCATDTLDKIDRKDLEQNVAAIAIMAYVLAEMPGRLGE